MAANRYKLFWHRPLYHSMVSLSTSARKVRQRASLTVISFVWFEPPDEAACFMQ